MGSGGRDEVDDQPSDDSEDSLLREIARIDDGSVIEAPEATRASGSRLGRFIVRGELGRGGMGIVYRADDEQLGRPVALKVLRDRKRSDPQRRARFLREARSAAALVHPRVATVYEVGETVGELYIAMELVAGESLRERLGREGHLSLEAALPIARGIARALAAAHAKGIVHRDLKPENVMLDADGEPKVLDFGLAKIDELVTPPREVLERQSTDAVLTEEGHVLGTPAYMSPEQAQGRAVDVRSDVFSFGIVLFEMLAGERPFKGESGMDMAIAIARDEPIDLAQVKPGLPRWVQVLVSRCLAKAPANRYASGRELSEVLDNEETGAQSGASRRGGALVVGAAAMVVAVVIGFGVWRSRAAASSDARSITPVQDSGVALPRSLTAYPPPPTKNAEAAQAYAAAMQDLRDASGGSAHSELERAVKLDPTFAAAYLRLLAPWFQNENTVVQAQALYAQAQRFRSALDPRERALLEVAEAVTHDPVQWKEVVTRLQSVRARYPDDLEVLAELADALEKTDLAEESRDVYARVMAIDPEFALMISELAWFRMLSDAPAARELLARCLALAPRANWCLESRAILERESGQCEQYESTSRQIVAAAPSRSPGFRLLADALAVRGAPIEGVSSLLAKASTLSTDLDEGTADEESAAEMRDENDIGLALLVGDFPRAIAAASDLDRLRAGTTNEAAFTSPALTIITSLSEEGHDDSAMRVAEDFERRTPAWTQNDARVRMYLLYARWHAGRVDEAAFRRQVDELQQHDESYLEAPSAASSRFWGHVANAGANPVDLDIARSHLDEPMFSGHLEAIRGRVLFLAGRLDEAIAPLKTGTQTCEILPTGLGSGWQGLQVFTFMHSRQWLGEALEAKGDTAGACANYSVIAERWKNARPRSVTLDKAKARMRALHCGAAP